MSSDSRMIANFVDAHEMTDNMVYDQLLTAFIMNDLMSQDHIYGVTLQGNSFMPSVSKWPTCVTVDVLTLLPTTTITTAILHKILHININIAAASFQRTQRWAILTTATEPDSQYSYNILPKISCIYLCSWVLRRPYTTDLVQYGQQYSADQ